MNNNEPLESHREVLLNCRGLFNSKSQILMKQNDGGMAQSHQLVPSLTKFCE